MKIKLFEKFNVLTDDDLIIICNPLTDIGFEVSIRKNLRRLSSSSIMFSKNVNFKDFYSNHVSSTNIDVEYLILKNREMSDLCKDVADACEEILPRLSEKYDITYFENASHGFEKSDIWRVWIDIKEKDNQPF